MDKLLEIETFVHVVGRGSFAGAAAAQDVTPVMISRRITQLERRIGGPLFQRSTRKLTLTPQGETFLGQCSSILARLETAERVVADGRRYATGHLIVSSPAAFGRRHVAPHLKAFTADNPDVKVSLNLNDHVVDLVRNGYEVGIRLGAEVDPGLVAVKLATSRSVLCATPAYLERFGTPSTPDDLARHNCLVYNEHGGQQRGWQFERESRSVLVRPTGSLSCNDAELLTLWVKQGLGLAWRPEWEIAADLASGRLVPVLEEYASPRYDIMAVYPPQKNLPAKIALFIAWMKSFYARADYWTPASPDEGPGAAG